MPSGPVTPKASLAGATRDVREVHRLNAVWVVRLRWAAFIGQAVTIGIVHGGMRIALPLVPLGVLLATTAVTNVGITLWLRRTPPVTEGALAAIMALDLCVFTGLLFFTGGPLNPFSSLYLVHLALAALLLSPRWTWTLALLAVGANAALFASYVPLPIGHGSHAAATADPHAHHRGHEGHAMEPAPVAGHDHGLDMHLEGMWVAFGVTAMFIVYFLHRVTRTLAEREAELTRIRETSARAERLASVATLAAGAGHELATPLSTIAVAARELERNTTGTVADDARLIREQVDRCRAILAQLAGDAGASPGEVAAPVLVRDLVDGALAGIERRSRVQVRFEIAEGTKVVLPPRAVTQAIRNVVQNAVDASSAESPIHVEVLRELDEWRVLVRDSGSGMPEGVLRQATDPFFTTKEPGQGMGLGLFLSRSVAEFLGGTLDIDSVPGKGTLVTLRLPDASAPGRAA